MPKNKRYVVGLDIGTSKICCLIAEAREAGGADVIGIGTSPSRGLRKGVVVNLESTVEAIKAAVEEAELMSGVAVERAYVGIAGGHIRSFNSRGVISTAGREEISQEDVDRVIEAARAVAIPHDREGLHTLPQEFVVDSEEGVRHPEGMAGSRLEAMVHMVTASVTSVQNIVNCVNKAGIMVTDTVLEQLAASDAVLTPDEKELGVALVDIGGGTTDIAIFERGSIWHTTVLPTGGDHLTNDIAVGLRAPIPDAERLKKKHGCAVATMVGEEESLDVPAVGGRRPRILSRRTLCEIIQPRAEETFGLINEEIIRYGFEKSLNAGVVLVGGGSMLEGLTDIAEQVFDLPVRCGAPSAVGGLADVVASPAFATPVGLVLYGLSHRDVRRRTVASRSYLGWVSDRFREILTARFL
jgi:cell division protein FtsA